MAKHRKNNDRSSPADHSADKGWMRLDNAAKIFPAARSRRWSNVFRVSVTLDREIDPALLQSAVDRTVPRFPSVAVRLNSGLFWYYLETVRRPPRVLPESDFPHPCARMKNKELKSCALRILYYKKRISAEFFHSVTDGTGALVFVKTLAAEYLAQRDGIDPGTGNGVLDRDEAPKQSELEDSFLRCDGEVTASRKEENAYQLKGHREPDGFLNVTTGVIDPDELLAEAHKKGVSLTCYLASVLAYVICAEQARQTPKLRRRKPVKILVPINLRRFFGGETMRNFVLYVTPSIDARNGDYSFDEILNAFHHQLGFLLTEKNLRTRITANVKPERSIFIRLMPLLIKNIVMKGIYNAVGEVKDSIQISNLGRAELPAGMESAVERFDFILGANATKHNSCAAVTYKNRLCINFSRTSVENDLEREFFTFLVRQGIHVLVESNRRYERQ